MSTGTMAEAIAAPAPGEEPKKDNGGHKRRRYQENAPVEVVPLSRIDSSIYSNYRQLSSNEKISGYVDSIRKIGLKQNLVAGIQPDGKLGLSCGFQRFEALERIAVEDVVNEYNKHFGYTPLDDNFVFVTGETKTLNPKGEKDWFASTLVMQKNRRRLREASPEWAKKYDDAMAAFETNVQVKKYKNNQEAMMDNIAENENRDNPSLADLVARVVLMRAEGMPAGAVATVINKSAPTISHYTRIAELIPFLSGLKETYEKELNGAQPNEEQAAFLRKMDVCIGEVDRRWKMPESNPCRLQFQTLRELSSTIDPAKDEKRLPVGLIFDIVTMMCRIGKDLEPTDTASYDESTFRARMRDMIEAHRLKLKDAEAKAAGAAAPAGTTDGAAAPAATGPVLNVNPASPEDAALIQSLSQQTGEAVPTPASGTVSPPTDAQRQASIDAANAQLEAESPTQTSGDDMIDEGDVGEDLMQGLAVPTESEVELTAGKVPTAPEDGQMRAKTTEATKSRYTCLPPEKVENLADALLGDLNNPELAETTSLCDAAGFLNAAKNLYYAVGLDDKQDAVNEVRVEFSEKVAAYIAALEEAVSGLPVEQKAKVAALKPALPRVELPKE